MNLGELGEFGLRKVYLATSALLSGGDEAPLLLRLLAAEGIVDVFEDWEALRLSVKSLDKGLFVGSGGIKRLELEEHGRVVVSVELLEAAVFVTEHAALAIHALLGVVERPAVLALEKHVVITDSRLGQLFLAMRETTLVLVPALGRLNPVFAKFGFVLAIGVAGHHNGDALHSVGVRLVGHGLLTIAILAIESAHWLLVVWREALRE